MPARCRSSAKPRPQPSDAASVDRRRTASPKAVTADIVAAAASANAPERGRSRPRPVHCELIRVQALGCHICCAWDWTQDSGGWGGRHDEVGRKKVVACWEGARGTAPD